MIISYERNLEENINEGIKTLEYHISSQNYPIVNEMLQLQIKTLQWVINKQKKEENSLESLKQVINFKIKRLEYELKIARRDIEHTSKIVYQLEMLECCKIIISWELKRRTKTKTTTNEDSISALC
ncbi:MAG TPA: hypothetical protein VFU79_04310 [Nitrososphaeraceae archaeon]|nr:hypothetical protein [Nitrososphaeraceae archaeon]